MASTITLILNRLEQAFSAQSSTAEQAASNRQLEHNVAYTHQELVRMLSDGVPPTAAPILSAKVEEFIGILAAQRPRFATAAVEDSDVDVAKVASDLLLYVWQESDFDSELVQCIKDDFVQGRAWAYVYVEPDGDFGRGEVRIRRLEPWEVYVDPRATKADCSDAQFMGTERFVTRTEGEHLFGKRVIDGRFRRTKQPVEAHGPRHTPSGRAYPANSEIVLPNHLRVHTSEPADRRYQLVEEFERIKVRRFITTEVREGVRKFERTHTKESLEAYKRERVIQIIDESGESRFALSREDAAYWGGQFGAALPIDPANPLVRIALQVRPDQSGIAQYVLIERSKEQLIQMGVIQERAIWLDRIRVRTLFGKVLIQDEELPVSEYPLVPLMTRHDGTPFPTAKATLVRSLIDQYNKYQQLQMIWGMSIAGPKITAVKNTILNPEAITSWGPDIVWLNERVAQGDAPIPAPFVMQELPAHFFASKSELLALIDLVTGLIPANTLGAVGADREPFRAVAARQEASSRRMTVSDVMLGRFLNALARPVMEFIRSTYTYEKVIRIENPSSPIAEPFTQHTVNQFEYDEYGQPSDILFDVTTLAYDVRFVRGSTFPTNRTQEREEFLRVYQVLQGAGMGDAFVVDLLKKFDIPNVADKLARVDRVQQLEQALAQAQEEIKQKDALIETGVRTSIEDRKRVEVEKAKRSIDRQVGRVERDASISSARMSDAQASTQAQEGASSNLEALLTQLFAEPTINGTT